MKMKIIEWSARFIHLRADSDVQLIRWYVPLTANIATIVNV
jgi:hypothetical protein